MLYTRKLLPWNLSLFHRRTRASYVYNGCLAWYNVVLYHSRQLYNIQLFARRLVKACLTVGVRRPCPGRQEGQSRCSTLNSVEAAFDSIVDRR